MAKRRTVTRNTSTRGVRSAGGASWKKSRTLAGLLIGAIVFIWIGVAINFFAGSSSPTAIADFPFTFITEDGADQIVKKAESTKPPQAPFSENGKVYWECWVCNNPECPGRKGDQPYMYANVIPFCKERLAQGKPPYPTPEEMKPGKNGEPPPMMMMEMYGMPQCPLCLAAKKEPFHVERYLTPEGRRLQDEARKKWEESQKKQNQPKKKK